jgi:membrane-associated phospholipid phosphatase
MNARGDNSNRRLRVVLALVVILLHFGVYRLVNEINSTRPASAFHDFSIFLDPRIPYLAWTFVIYYLALPYVMAMGTIVAGTLPSRRGFHAIAAFAVLIVIGGALQLEFPARSPWPAQVTPVQRFFHEISFDPFVCLPSMHVALATLTAALSADVFRSPRAKFLNGSVAIAISISTLTLKEHYLLDVIAGVLFAAVIYLGWRRWPPVAAARL